jgi:hypothetical protein
MSGTMQCPSCKEQIDDDSHYCDQCGEQILVCSICGRPGKGKRCIFDGKEMIPAGSVVQQPSQTTQINQPAPAPVVGQVSQPVQQSLAVGDKLKLSSGSHGITIEVSDGDIIGRKAGPFAGVFGNFSTVSGTHCKFVKTNGTWCIQDMGSTNGTFCNNSRLAPNTSVPLQDGTSIKIADVELLVTLNANNGTVRV